MFQSTHDVRLRVIIQLFTSTGMRMGAIPVLTMKDLKTIDKYDIYEITAYANSRKSRYKTYCSPETRRELGMYLKYRQNCGEQITDTSPVIREKFDKSNTFRSKYRQNLYIINKTCTMTTCNA